MLLACVLLVHVGAKDITAITAEGRVVVLHDNGKWEYRSFGVLEKPYVGIWGFSEEFFDTLVELSLLESNIYPDSPEYEFYKAIVSEMINDEFIDSGLIELELTDDGYVYMTVDGEEEMALYSVDEKSRVLTLIEDEESIPFGIFSEDYSKLNIMGMEGFSFSKIN